MPFYEYQCSACKHHLEVMQKVDAPRLKKCPNCGKSTLTRLISAPVFRLAGKGWYETDFKSDKENKRNLVGEKEVEPASSAEKSTDSKDKSDSKDKADTKADAKSSDSGDKGSAKDSAKPATAGSAAAKGGKTAETRRTVSRKPAPKAPVRKAPAKGKRR